MTEAEWFACKNLSRLLDFLNGKANDRKLRLFAAACCQRVEHLLPAERRRECLNAIDRWAEGSATTQELEAAVTTALDGWEPEGEINTVVRENVADVLLAILDSHANPLDAARGVASRVASALTVKGSSFESEGFAQINLLREITGNPFRPVPPDPAWLTNTVTTMAHAIYEERRFENLPILADALEDAGCADPTILTHCRGSGPHARGCWVVDLILGKSDGPM